jgi:hypothetical protein
MRETVGATLDQDPLWCHRSARHRAALARCQGFAARWRFEFYRSGGKSGRQFLGGRSAAEREREALEVAGMFPVAEGRRGCLKGVEGSVPPELFVIDSMAALDLAVLLRAARPDIAMSNPCLLDGKREGQ